MSEERPTDMGYEPFPDTLEGILWGLAISAVLFVVLYVVSKNDSYW